MPPDAERPTWLRSDRFLARAVARPVNRFLQVEASSGILLGGAALVALIWANSAWSDGYTDLWSTSLTVDLGGHAVTEDLRHWINDGLMALFFFVIGLEIKQEIVDGQLTSARDAAVPVAGALGGMVLPAGIYLAFNLGGVGAHGWGIPMATDVAFAVGVLALLGRRAPAELKVLLLSLAIVDDIGAIIIIAVFYSQGLDGRWCAAAAVGLLLVMVAQRARIRFLPVYVVLGTFVWLATFESGIHATIAGVTLGLLTPARPLLPPVDADRIADELSTDVDVTANEVRDISFRLREAVPVTERLQDLLHPWTSYVIVPLFALANAGVVVTGGALGNAASSPITLGVVVGPRPREARGRRGSDRLGDQMGDRPATHRRHDPSHRRDGRHRRYRVHRVDLRGRPGLRRPGADRRGQARGTGRVLRRRRARQRRPAARGDGRPRLERAGTRPLTSAGAVVCRVAIQDATSSRRGRSPPGESGDCGTSPFLPVHANAGPSERRPPCLPVPCPATPTSSSSGATPSRSVTSFGPVTTEPSSSSVSTTPGSPGSRPGHQRRPGSSSPTPSSRWLATTASPVGPSCVATSSGSTSSPAVLTTNWWGPSPRMTTPAPTSCSASPA